MKVLIAGGGTAGHIFPALATAEKLQSAHGAQVRFVGTAAGLEAGLVPRAGFDFNAINAKPFRREFSARALSAPFALFEAAKECRPMVSKVDVVLGMGGYVSAPALMAARRAGIPYLIHEQNAVPGLANRFFAAGARIVALSFEDSTKRFSNRANTVVIGNPVRAAIANLASLRDSLRDRARKELGLESNRRTLLVTGGSQGALHLNKTIIDVCRRLRGKGDQQVVVLAGAAHGQEVTSAVNELGLAPGELKVVVVAFLDQMELAYSAADLVLSRAGATSIAEITCAGLASILVPYPFATANHQEANARVLERAGAAEVILDKELTSSELANRIERLFSRPADLLALGAAASKWSKPKAAENLANLVAGTSGAGR